MKNNLCGGNQEKKPQHIIIEMKQIFFNKDTSAFKEGKKVLVDDDYNYPNSIRLLKNGYVAFKSGELRDKYIHRIIMNCPPDKQIDHINHNPLDNRRENLRICTRRENALNRGRPKNSSTGFKGVHRYKDKYKAVVETKSYGIFDTAQEAYDRYCEVAKELHGEYFCG